MCRSLVYFAVVCLGAFVGCAEKPPDTAPSKKDAPPPADKTIGTGDVQLTLTGTDGVDQRLAALKGKVVLIDCWATWCGPCVASFPKLIEKHQKYADKGLAVISVSNDDPDEAKSVLEFLQRQKATFTNLHLSPEQPVFRWMTTKFAYDGGIPHAALFDRTGKRVWAGHPMDPALTAAIEAELAKSGG
jgi:thiol-disulfide isomerase/thioredoxin